MYLFKPKYPYHESQEYFLTRYFTPSPNDTDGIMSFLSPYWKIYRKRKFFKHQWIFEDWKAWSELSTVRYFVNRKICGSQLEAESVAMLKILEQESRK